MAGISSLVGRRPSQVVQNLPANAGNTGSIPGQAEKAVATHSSILSWQIPWTEGYGGPQSMASQESDKTQWLNKWYKNRREDKAKRQLKTHWLVDLILTLSQISLWKTLGRESALLFIYMNLIVFSGNLQILPVSLFRDLDSVSIINLKF